jgi:hypothetical protein
MSRRIAEGLAGPQMLAQVERDAQRARLGPGQFLESLHISLLEKDRQLSKPLTSLSFWKYQRLIWTKLLKNSRR